MNNILRRVTAALLSGMMLTGLASCSSSGKQSSSEGEGNLAADGLADDASYEVEDMEYGATIMQLKPSIDEGLKVAVEYDYRYLTTEQGYLLSDYVHALNTCDGDLMEQVYYPPYLKGYVIDSGDYGSTTEYLESFHSTIEESLGEGYEYNYILVEDCYTEDDDINITGFDEMDAKLDAIGDGNGGKVSDKIDEGSRRLLYIDIMYGFPDDPDDNGSYSLRNHVGYYMTLYMYSIDGKDYIV